MSEALLHGGFAIPHRLIIAGRRAAFLALLGCAGLAAGQIKVDRVRVGAAYAETLLIKRVAPAYPVEAKAKGIQGKVLLRVKIDKDGNVENAELISGDPLLSAFAIDAVKQWKYKPYLLNGAIYKVETEVTVNFAPAAMGVVGDVPGGAFSGIGSVQSPVATEGVPQRVRVSSAAEQARLVKKVAPDYPDGAKEKRIQGQVVLSVIVGKGGDVEHVKLVSGHPLLEPAAIDAVWQWKYKPYFLNGKPVQIETQVMVSFTLMQ